MLADPEYIADVNPVDVVCNGLIAASWKTATESPRYEDKDISTTALNVDSYVRKILRYQFITIAFYRKSNYYSLTMTHNIKEAIWCHNRTGYL